MEIKDIIERESDKVLGSEPAPMPLPAHASASVGLESESRKVIGRLDRNPELDRIKAIDLRDFLRSRYGMVFDQHDRTLCPFHDDHDPSLSVFRDKGDGSWRWSCFGCRAGGDIFDFLRLKEELEIPEALASLGAATSESSPSRGQRREPARKSITTFVYRSESGTPLFRKIKYSSREYRAERFENGTWKPGLKDVRRVLYNLPELLAAPRVFLLEGEKDCETVKALGHVATTMGSVSQWKSEYAEFFGGKDVLICFDVGNEKYAERAAADIVAKASRVRILNLPGLTEREQDITDWFELMEDVPTEEKYARLSSVIDSTPDFIPSERVQGKTSEKGAISLPEFLIRRPAPRDIFMDRWAEREHLTILSGPQKTGKSILVVNLSLSISAGKDFLGFKVPRPRRVFYLQQEISEPAMLERLQRMVSVPGFITSNFMIKNTGGGFPKLTSRSGRDRLRELIGAYRPDLLVLDPFSTFHSQDENSATDMSSVLDPIYDLKHEFHIGVLLVHHFGKPSIADRKGSQRLRGSSVIGDRADNLIMLEPGSPPRAGVVFPTECYGKISFTLRNDQSPASIGVVRNPLTLWYQELSPDEFTGRKVTASRIVEVVGRHGGQILQSELERLPDIGGSRGTVLAAVKEAISKGLIVAENLPTPGGPVLLKLVVRPS